LTDADVYRRIMSRCTECGDCLLWPGAMGGRQRETPQVSIGGQCVNVRRLVWAHEQAIPLGKRGVSNTCGNKRCIKHLAPTTASQRSKKAGQEGKFSGIARCAKIARTKRAQTSQLTPEKVSDILHGGGTLIEAAMRNGVSKSVAASVRQGRTWRDYSSPWAGLMASNDGGRRAA